MKFSIVLIFLIFSFVFSYADEDVLRPKGKPAGYYGEVTDDNYEFLGLPFSLGFEVGANYNMFSQDIIYNPPLNQPLSQNYDNGSGLSPYFGVFADFSFNETIGLHIKLQYNQVQFGNKGTGLVDGYIYDEFNQIIDILETSYSLEWTNEFSYFNIEPSIRINLTDKLFGLVGISAQIPISNVKQSTTITALEDGFYFENGQNKQTFEDEADLLKNKFGLNLSLGYRFNISNDIDLVPQVHYHYFPSKISDDVVDIPDYSKEITEQISYYDVTNSTLNALRFSLAIWFNL